MLVTNPIALFFFVLGLAFGSFANVIIYRLPHRESICGRSRCPHCKHVLEPRDLLPLLSFIILKGKCRYCGERIAWRYPLMELSVGIIFLFALSLFPAHLPVALLFALTLGILLIIAVIDAETQRIPDALNIPFLLFALFFAIFTQSFTVVGPLVAAGFFFAQWFVSQGKWVGSGDIILASGVGFLLGDWPRVVLAIVISYIIGAAVGSVLLLSGKKTRHDHLPFGPFLALGTLFVLIWGDDILFLVFFL